MRSATHKVDVTIQLAYLSVLLPFFFAVVDGYDFAPNFSVWTVLEECLNPPIVYDHGRIICTEPFSGETLRPFLACVCLPIVCLPVPSAPVDSYFFVCARYRRA